MNTPLEVAMIAARALADKKAISISVLQISDLTVMADYFVICTGSSTTHLKTLAAGEKLGHVEGRGGGTWVLMDFGCLVVHLFMAETRAFYDLERLWQDAPRIKIDGLEA
jgi:ribosome-associated protein